MVVSKLPQHFLLLSLCFQIANLIISQLRCYAVSFYFGIKLKQINEMLHNTLPVPFEKSKFFSFTCSRMKNVVFPAGSKFPVK